MQADIMIWLQGLFEGSYGFFDAFFTFITFFGEELVLFIVLPIFYWAINKEMAEIGAVAGFATMTLNGMIKDICEIPRPIGTEGIRFVEVENFFVDTVHLKEGSYSFPSGHSQTSSVMMFSIASYYNKKKLWIFSSVLVLLVMISRLYLGVHWPLDVLIGGMLGLISAIFFYKLLINKKDDTRVKIYFIVACICLVALFFAEKSDTYKSIGASFGFALGALFERKYVNFDPKEGTFWKKVLRCLIGIIIVGGLKIGLKPLFGLFGDFFILDFFRYMILVFVAIAIYPLVFKKLKL